MTADAVDVSLPGRPSHPGRVLEALQRQQGRLPRLRLVKEMLTTASDPHVRQIIRTNFEREANILATTSHPAMPPTLPSQL